MQPMGNPHSQGDSGNQPLCSSSAFVALVTAVACSAAFPAAFRIKPCGGGGGGGGGYEV